LDQVSDPGTAPAVRGPTQVLWLARLDRLKGADLLPAIARAVWQEITDVQFHLIGQQSTLGRRIAIDWIRSRLPATHRAKIVYLGGLPYADTRQRLAQYGLAVFTSSFENFPYAELECMWAGIACVSASGGGAAELGNDGESHIRTERRPEAIAAAVVDLLRNGSKRESIAAAAREHVRSRFAGPVIAARMTEVYELACRWAAVAEHRL
jgi:glycosyltransferase involved in cell wall biosynthesis